jgi:hypothetical protein
MQLGNKAMTPPNNAPILRDHHTGQEGLHGASKKPLKAFMAIIGFSLLATVLWIGVLFWMAWQTVGEIALTLVSGPA